MRDSAAALRHFPRGAQVACQAGTASVLTPKAAEARRHYESTKEMYAADTGMPYGVTPSCADLLPYARVGSPAAAQLATNRVHDVLGRPIAINAIGQLPQLNTVSWDQFAGVVGEPPQVFWGDFGHY